MRLRFARGSADELETLHPASFALVMATGIVAIALDLHDVPVLPHVLFWLNAALFTVLVAATLLRIVRYPAAFAADISNHSRGVGFFTLVAACSILGQQLILHMRWMVAATVVWFVAVSLLVVVTYGLLTVLTVGASKPSLERGIHGGWLIAVVAPQSVAILTVLLLGAGVFPDQQHWLAFVAFALWLGGGALYLWLMTLIFLRYTFLDVSPDDLTPPYWISMGAVAISTLAGATLVEHAYLSPLVTELAVFVKGMCVFFWAIGSWWIPMLVLIGIWRYLIRGLPFTYDPLYWGGVFPLGMYSTCTHHLARTFDLPFLMPVSSGFLVLAVVAWTGAFVMLVDSRLHAGAGRVPSHAVEREER